MIEPARPADYERLRRSYMIYVHHDLRRWRLRPWWATMSQGMGSFSELVWRARTRERLLVRCERWIFRDMLSRGVRGSPTIRIEDR